MRLSTLALVASLAVAAPALAGDPVPAAPAGPAATDATPHPAAPREPEIDRHCLKETGTRIRARAGERRCTAFLGRVYSREDIERTGEVDLAAALRRLDTAIH